MMPLGCSGVDIFFVISGFIICQIGPREHAGTVRFLARRCWRIFPLYWVVLTFSLAVCAFGLPRFWIPSAHSPLDYVLLLSTDNPYLPQAWSLVFELYFYVSVALVLLVSPKGRFFRTLAFWLVMQTVLIALRGPEGGPPVNALSLEFGLGCVVAWLNARNLILRIDSLGGWDSISRIGRMVVCECGANYIHSSAFDVWDRGCGLPVRDGRFRAPRCLPISQDCTASGRRVIFALSVAHSAARGCHGLRN